MAPEPPTHLLAESWDDVTLCGQTTHGRDAVFPQLTARFLAMHQEGRARAGVPPLVICDGCAVGQLSLFTA